MSLARINDLEAYIIAHVLNGFWITYCDKVHSEGHKRYTPKRWKPKVISFFGIHNEDLSVLDRLELPWFVALMHSLRKFEIETSILWTYLLCGFKNMSASSQTGPKSGICHIFFALRAQTQILQALIDKRFLSDQSPPPLQSLHT